MRTRYKFNITWVHLAGNDPEYRYQEYGIEAISVPRAVSKVLGDLNEAGFARRDIRVIDVQNMDIC